MENTHLYTVPKNKPNKYSLVIRVPKFRVTIVAPSDTNTAHAVHANGTLNSPAAMGKNGLFTLSMSTS